MFTNYANTGCKIQVNYQPVGSGAGINQLLAQTVDFGATDAPMTDTQLAQSQNGPILHIPVTMGAAVDWLQPAEPVRVHASQVHRHGAGEHLSGHDHLLG